MPNSWEEFPKDFEGNSVIRPEIFYCPADTEHPAQYEWAGVDFNAISYELVAPGILRSAPEQVFIRCRVHQNSISSRGKTVETKPYTRSIPLLGLNLPTYSALHESAISLKCLGQLRTIGSTAVQYASDNGDVLPQSFAYLRQGDWSPEILRCPADVLNPVPPDFSDASLATANYSFDSPGASIGGTDVRVATCRIHGHYVMSNGSTVTGTNRYPPRIIIGHPLSRTVAPGHSTTLEVVTGDAALGPYKFQWRRLEPINSEGVLFTNTVEIGGATNATLVVTNAGPENEGYYDVVVSWTDGQYQLSEMAYVRVDDVAGARWWNERIVCRNNLSMLGLAARTYASTHNDVPAADLPSLVPFLGWPFALFCPADFERSAPVHWEAVDFEKTSYTFTPQSGGEATNVAATCRIHGFKLRGDLYTITSDPPWFIPSRPTADGKMVLSLVVDLNKICLLQESSDLARWSGVFTNLLTTNSTIRWTNSNWKTDGAKFYRAIMQ